MKRNVSFVIIWLLSTMATPAMAEPLLLNEVLQSSRQHVPDILESLEKLNAAEGEALAAKGAFDLIFNSDGFDRVDGFWDGSVAKTQVEQGLRPLGATVFGGYKISDGAFPIYEDENFTNSGGEVSVGAVFSLLRDRAIDLRRFNEFDTDLATKVAELELALVKIGVQQRAANAYWRWVTAGQKLGVYRNLLNIAQERQEAMEQQVEEGEVAEIFLVENMQNLTRRQSLVVQGEQMLQRAANSLSFFYRNTEGLPIVPSRQDLPEGSVLQPGDERLPRLQSIETIINQRPELRILQTEMERTLERLRLADNQLLPKLDLNVEVSRDLGSVAEGGRSRDSTDTVIGFRISQPLQNRAARGKQNQTRAELKALEFRQRQMEDNLTMAMREIFIELNAAEELVDIAQQEVEQARIMQDAERQRFQGGDSDFFLLNRREEATADAVIRLLGAQQQLKLATVNFQAAALQLEPLAMDDLPL